MRRISAWAITHPVFPLVLFAVLTVFGIVAFVRMPVTLNPDVSAPFVHVFIGVPGSAPSEIETQVLQKVEGSVSKIGNVKNIISRATEGQAMVFVEFQIGTPVDRATTDVRDAIARVRADLPPGILEPQVGREEIDGGPIVYYAVSTTGMTEEQLSWFVDDTLNKRLLGVPGVAQVNRSGGVNREMRVDLDPARMQSSGITAAEVNDQLRQVNVDAAGGRAQVGGGEQSIRVLGSARTAQLLADTRLTLGDGRVVRLDAIVEIENITRHMKMGKSGYQAAMDAADEIGLAVVACSMAIIAVFLPVSFMGGLVGQFFIQFGFTVAVAVFLSLVVARLISPLLAAYTLKPHAGLRGADGPIMEWYLKALRWTVKNRWKTLGAGLVYVVLSIGGLLMVPQAFFPDSDSSSSVLKVELPPGVLLSQTSQVSAAAYQILRRRPEVKSIVESVGEDDDGEVRSGNIFIQLVPPAERKLSQKAFEAQLTKELRVIPDARLNFQSQADGGV